MFRFRSLAPAVALVAVAGLALPECARASGTAEEILRRYAVDYAADPNRVTPTEFGVQVGEEKWHVRERPAADGAPATVEVVAGFPSTPGWYFTLDLATLEKIDRGEWNALTAMGKALETDFAPIDVAFMEGFQPTPEFAPRLLSTLFHFWTRGLPETIPFGGELTRPLHGAQASILYYQPGFRSGFVQIRKGQHANADPKDQKNPFPTLLVPTAGRAIARIGGVEVEMKKGVALFIPPKTAHEFWNPYDEPAEAILLMFGDGA